MIRLDESDQLAIIEDHDRYPRNFGRIDAADRTARGLNPICGDRYDVFIVEKDDAIDIITFDGHGCAISKSSGSIMTESLRGLSLDRARQKIEDVRTFLRGDPDAIPPDLPDELGALARVHAYPARMKCVTLAWHAAAAALEGAKLEVSTE